MKYSNSSLKCIFLNRIYHEFHLLLKPTKLREGNVFSRICVSMGWEVPMRPLPMMHWTSLYRDPLDIFKRGIFKREVRTLLESFLVSLFFQSNIVFIQVPCQ